MTEPSTPRYRFWGNQQPTALAPITDTAANAGKSATMRIYGPIDSWGAPFGVSAEEFGQALDALSDDVDTINMHMHSPGGEVFEGLAIMNQLRQHKAKVNLVVDGIAASIASVIAMGADTVAMAPGAQMMIHDASGICIGTAEDMATMNARLESLSSNIADVYAARAGGDPSDWRAAMQPESWFKAQEAVDAGLADRVLSKDEAPVQPTATFDLSMFAHAGREHAPDPIMPAARATKTPADSPVAPPNPKEADTMSEPTKSLRAQLGLAEDADDAAVSAKVDELLEQATAPAPEPAPVAEADPKSVRAALEAEGFVVMTKAKADALADQAEQGAQARAKQITDERTELIDAAMSAGKINRSDETRKVWESEFERDFALAKADLASLPARFPVSQIPGFPGGENVDSTVPFTEAEGDALGALAGLPKGALK